ncbi:MAG: LuxR C-terminal-related transcriptional regulator [Treponema sp.]|jgi:LuxR family maltose regulon positive regulatory protein|nr:LuxR C-terminal-related transcriptional regulator [Treponema sp.]
MGALIHSTVTFREGNQVYLERPRIRRLFEGAVQHPIVFVTAGAGYGKTQAVYSFLQNTSAITGWLQFSERDNIPDRFWENFTAVIGFIDKNTARRLAEDGFPSTGRRFDRYLAIPREEVIPQARYIFVYDDYHLIHNEAVLRFMEQSIFTPFSNIVSIVISRSSPDVGVARGYNPVWITEEDLRFTREETAKYFLLQGIRVSRRTVATVYRDTEGWAFAVHLSALFLKRLSVPHLMREGHRLPGMRINIFRLLETELMGSVSPDLRKFLVKISLLDALPQDLLESLNPPKDLLEEMERIVSFIRWDSYSRSWIIHHLFLEYLGSLQGELTAEEKSEVYRTAARWCSDNDRKIDALSYYEKAGDYDSIIDILEWFPIILPDRTGEILKGFLDRAPKPLYGKNPMLWTLYAKICISLGFFAECIDILHRHIKELEESPAPPGGEELRIWALLCSHVFLGFVGLVNSTDTEDYSYVEDFKRATEYQRLNVRAPGYLASTTMLGSYICRVREGDPKRIIPYLQAIEAASVYAVRAYNGGTSGMADLAWGEYLYFRGDISQAEVRLREALRKARERNQYEIENRSLFYLLRVALYQGHDSDREEALRNLAAQKKQERYINRFVHHDVIMGWYYTQIGEPERIASWLKNDFEDSEINNRGRGLEILVKAKYHLCKKNYPAALASLSGRKDFEWGLLLGRLEALALESVCRYAGRDREGTLRCLRGYYGIGKASGIALPLVELGHFTRSLIDWVLKQPTADRDRRWLLDQRRGAAAYAKKLFAGSGKENRLEKGRDNPAASTGILSPREMEVLSCISRGLTRVEIAEALSLSINTVKSLIRSIYNKLGAINRSHAIKAAAAAGLLRKAE